MNQAPNRLRIVTLPQQAALRIRQAHRQSHAGGKRLQNLAPARWFQQLREPLLGHIRIAQFLFGGVGRLGDRIGNPILGIGRLFVRDHLEADSEKPGILLGARLKMLL